jgi:hypothetical protein
MAAFRPQIVAAITRNLRGGRCERIRTSDPFLPKEVRYQAAPHTEVFRLPKREIRAKIIALGSVNFSPLSNALTQ